jgi:hypothetical protein
MLYSLTEIKNVLVINRKLIARKLERGTPVSPQFAKVAVQRFGTYAEMLTDHRNPDAAYYAECNAWHIYNARGLQGLLDHCDYKLSLSA